MIIVIAVANRHTILHGLAQGARVDRWITDTQISKRFGYYTRANADEVGPDPFSPLGWSLGWIKGCIPGVAQGFVDFGVLEHSEFALDPPEVFGNWGGYFYNQLSLPRLMGCRMPGATPAAIDQAYFGDHPGVPEYEPHPDDENETQSAKLADTMAWVMSTKRFEAMEESAALSRQIVRERPELALLSDAELVFRARQMAPIIYKVWTAYCQVALGASLGPGAVQAMCDAVGRGEDAVKVMAAVGDVESAESGLVMWDLSRLVKESGELTAFFDEGVIGLLKRIEDSTSPDSMAFKKLWHSLLVEHGHRGPNEWDMRSHSWFTAPELPLSMLERLRFQTTDRSPHLAKTLYREQRRTLVVELISLLEHDAQMSATFEAGLASAMLFYSLRELGKSACIRVIHEAKLAIMELGQRMVDRGIIADMQQVFMLLDNELDAFVVEPQLFVDTIARRDVSFAQLALLEPPYIVGYEQGVAPISQWPRRNALTHGVVVSVGEVLQGAAGAQGIVTGIARVVLDPADASDIEPTDIMIAPTTDPSWAMLFLSVAGVVVNIGAVASHAAIVSRELGIACVVSVLDATRRIPDGATITIDGSTGCVTILSLP